LISDRRSSKQLALEIAMLARFSPYAAVALIVGMVSVALAADSPAEKSRMPSMVIGGEVTLKESRSAVLALAGNVAVVGGSMGYVATAAGTVQMTGGEVDNFSISGGTVALNGGRVGDLRVAAGDLKINNRITGDVQATAGTIVTTRDAVMSGDVELSGGDVAIDGVIENHLSVRAEHITIAGTIGGTVRLSAENIDVVPGTRIGGDLIYAGTEDIDLPEDVEVGGKVLRRDAEKREQRERDAMEDDSSFFQIIYAAWTIVYGGLILCGALLLLIWPSLYGRAMDRFVRGFPGNVLAGFIAYCALPVAFIILAFTLIGIPVAFLAMAAAAVVTGFGLILVCAWAGDRVRARFGRPEPARATHRFGWGLVGFTLFLVAGLVPVIGALAQGLAILAGTGATLRALWGQRA